MAGTATSLRKQVGDSTSSPSTDLPKASSAVAKDAVALTKQERADLAIAGRAYIRSKLRTDWDYHHPRTTPDRGLLGVEGIQWRERELDEPISDQGQFTPTAESTRDTHHDKKRKREPILDEVEWNEGLRLFMKRRDCWTGAQPRSLVCPRVSPPPSDLAYPTQSLSSSPADAVPPTPPPKNDSPSQMRAQSRTDLTFTPAVSILAPALQSSWPSEKSTQTSTPTKSTTKNMLIPVAPPLFPPDNPLRLGINQKTYLALYRRIVVQGLAPTISVNLSDMTRAMVVGWKHDGEWPPKPPEVPEKDPPRKLLHGRDLVEKSVGRVRRALGLGEVDQG